MYVFEGNASSAGCLLDLRSETMVDCHRPLPKIEEGTGYLKLLIRKVRTGIDVMAEGHNFGPFLARVSMVCRVLVGPFA